MSEVLKSEENPYRTQSASLESDGRTVYLYLNPVEGVDLVPRAVWVMNLVPAPAEDADGMIRGQAPVRSRAACAHPNGMKAPHENEIDFVWFQEGTGVTLYVEGEIWAVIPPFSGSDGFYGFCREATLPEHGTFPLPDGMKARAKENLDFWNRRTQKGFWAQFQGNLLRTYEAAFGPHNNYYALDNGKFPAMGLAEFSIPGTTLRLFATIGMSAQNMPGVELHVKNPEPLFRVELLTVREAPHPWFIDSMSRVALLPWRTGGWVGPGHSIQFGRSEPMSDYLVLEHHLVQDQILADMFAKLPSAILDERYARTFLFLWPAVPDDFRVNQARGREFLAKKNSVVERFS